MIRTEQRADAANTNHDRAFILASCRSGTRIAQLIAAELDKLTLLQNRRLCDYFLPNIDYQFPDTETCVELAVDPRNADVFLVQSLFDPSSERTIDENYMALLIAARALKEYGAPRVVAVLPHMSYIRQDKPTSFKREPITAQLVATLSRAAGIDRVITWHVNSTSIYDFYRTTPITVLSPVNFFAEAFSLYRNCPDTIVIAPDQGAVQYASQLARSLGVSFGYAVKERISPTSVKIREVATEAEAYRNAILFDDLISSAGTLHALGEYLTEHRSVHHMIAGASHAVCTGMAIARLRDMHERFGLRRVVVTNSVPQTEQFRDLTFVDERSIATSLARSILEQYCHIDRFST